LVGGRELESRGRDAAALARFLDEPRETFGTRVRIAERDQSGKVVGSRDAHVWHASLSLHPEEPALSDERWGQLAERFVGEMGFAGEGARAQCRWVAVRHGESVGGSDHVHLVVGLVAEDGSKASVHFDKKRAQQAARMLEGEFGLRRLEARDRRAGSRGLEPGEIAADRRRGHEVGERGEHAERSSRQRLERVVRACAAASGNESEFVSRLREHGVQARARYAKGGREEVVGYSVRLNGPSQGSQRTVWYGGGRLARDLTLPRLRARWPAGGGGLAAWPAVARAEPGGPARTADADPMVWSSQSAELGELRERLRGVPAGDLASWGHVAQETAGAFAAWSVRVEGEPGPLAATARALARSGELRAWQARGRLASLPSARGAALLLIAAAPGGSVAEAVMLRQLANLAKAVHDMHQAAGELQRAREIEAVVRGELAAFAEQLRATADPRPGAQASRRGPERREGQRPARPSTTPPARGAGGSISPRPPRGPGARKP